MSQISGDEILERIAGAGRRVLPLHRYMAEHHADGLDGFNQFLTSTIYENDALEPKYREIVLAAACVAAGSSQPVIAAHCRKAMEAGATREEVLQALELTAAVFATRTLGAGVLALIEADQE